MVLYAWDWDLPAGSALHDLLANSTKAKRDWRALGEARVAVRRSRPLAVAAALATPPRRDAHPNLLRVLERVDRALQWLESELPREWTKQRAGKGIGRPPDAAMAALLRFLGTLFQLRTGDPRFERITRLLRAADLPLSRSRGFDRDVVRKRYYVTNRSPFAAEIKALLVRRYGGK